MEYYLSILTVRNHSGRRVYRSFVTDKPFDKLTEVIENEAPRSQTVVLCLEKLPKGEWNHLATEK